MDRVRRHFIQADNFRIEAAPPNPLPYVFAEQVSRGNYLSFLTEGFILARGHEQYHRDHWGLVRKYTGFQWLKTLNIFLCAGGWSVLSSQEKVDFIGLVSRIRDHKGKLDYLSNDAWNRRFNLALVRVKNDWRYIADPYEGLSPMEAIAKLKELRAKSY